MSLTCAGCPNEIPNKVPYLTCSLCTSNYDLDCANVSEARFYNTMSLEHKKTWKCQMCRCKEPKGDNTDSPIHSQNPSLTEEPSNITQRKKRYQYINDSLDSSCDISTLGDTIHQDLKNNKRQSINDMANQNEDRNPIIMLQNEIQTPLTVEKMYGMLLKNNTSLIEALKSTIHDEIQRAISQLKTELIQKTNNIEQVQIKLKNELLSMTQKIESIEKEYSKLRAECNSLQINIQTLRQPENKIKKVTCTERYKKIIVLHGLTESYWETEAELCDRVTNILRDILNIDISDYIEEISRIGRRISNRPLKIELLSRRMSQFILQNDQYFNNTGLTVTEYLDEQALKERNSLKLALRTARKNGKHAIIRNNQLIIDGKVISTMQMQTENLLNETIRTNPNHHSQQSPPNSTRHTIDNRQNIHSNSSHSFRY